MAEDDSRQDQHFPSFTLDNFIRKLFEKQDRFDHFVEASQVVADLGCGPGYFTISLADKVGATGLVYAVDSDAKAIRVVEKKAARRNCQNIEAHTASAARLDFIQDASVDFVLANGLFCCVAPKDRPAAVLEIKRILKPAGRAYLITGGGRLSYVNEAAWEDILREFKVEERNRAPYHGDYWALVSLQ